MRGTKMQRRQGIHTSSKTEYFMKNKLHLMNHNPPEFLKILRNWFYKNTIKIHSIHLQFRRL